MGISDSSDTNRLRISEIFYSLQGEADAVGWPTLFVRLTGCPLRCGYCDTTHAFSGGQWKTIEQILDEASRVKTRHVCVTGGEPLAQKNVLPLLTTLCDQGYEVSLETSGSLPVDDIDPRVVVVMDLKTPASGEMENNCYDNIPLMKATDQIKFVICDRGDYEWAKDLVLQKKLHQRCQVLFSSAFSQVKPSELAEWIIADQLPVRFQYQLHKILWGDEPGR
jgi:7-carboxy-7-deazaguanine synthase